MKKSTCFVLLNLFFSGLFAQTFAPLPYHITVNRPDPLMDFPTPTIINIETYSNVAADDGAGISQAINDAIALGSPVKIIFKPNGIYHVDNTKNTIDLSLLSEGVYMLQLKKVRS